MMRAFYSPFLGKVNRRGKKQLIGSSILTSVPSTPQTLYKRSDLGINRVTGEIVIIPLTGFFNGISMNSKAKCTNLLPHKPPFRPCSCGFYGYTKRKDAETHIQGGSILLQIVASGKMFEYDKGFRYEHQRIEVMEAPKCSWCSNAAIHFSVDHQSSTRTMLWPSCKKRHGRRKLQTKTISFGDVAERASKSLPVHAPRITIKANDSQ